METTAMVTVEIGDVMLLVTGIATLVGLYFLGALLALTFRNVIGAPFFGLRPLKFENVRHNGAPVHGDTDWAMLFFWPVAIVLWDVTRLLVALPKSLTLRVILLSNRAGNRITETKNRYITGGRNG